MNKDKIFGLFEGDSDVKSNVEETKKRILAFQNSPHSKLGMFTKLILNHFVFHDKLEKFLKKEEPSYDVESTREASEFVVFNRAWSYINQINPEEESVENAVLTFSKKLLSKAINSSLSYFESLEEYEKCAHIHKFQSILKKD